MKTLSPKHSALNYFILFIALPIILLSSCTEQNIIEVKLTAQEVQKGKGPRWSPKGEKLQLAEKNNGLETKLQLGSLDLNSWSIRMTKTDESKYFNSLFIDHNKNGEFEDTERITIEPSESRGKIWSSFNSEIYVSVTDPWTEVESKINYPLSFWYVFNPNEDAPEQVIRYSRRAWMEGTALIDGVEASVLLTESMMDGKIDTNDAWAIAPTADIKELYDSRNSRSITNHAWLNDKAYKIIEVHSSGLKLNIEAFDPGISREEEAIKMDMYAPDKNAAHSGAKVMFEHHFKLAEENAKKENKNLFIDFETTWCGPCKLMDKIVYTADDVVKASENIIAVKVDGDDFPDLVKRFEVNGYPTLILVSPSGNIIKKKVGYQSVKQTKAFLETIE